MSTTLIKNATPVDANGAAESPCDVLVSDDVVKQCGVGLTAPDGATEIDGSGCLLLPGLFDMNVHLREPGREDKESITTGSAAAAHGGVTGILAMPNTDPPIDTGGMVQSVRDLASKKSCVRLLTAGCLTKGRAGKQMAAIAAMAEEGVCLLTDDPSPVADPQLLRRCMEYARQFDVRVASHCSTATLIKDGAMNEGPTAYQLGLPGMPAMAEELAIFRDLELARLTRCKLHIQHVSTARGLDLIRQAKNDGIDVTCEVALHHLIFTDEAVVGYDTRFKMDPPLRTAADRQALITGVEDGSVDVLVSDHAPHTDFEKSADFNSAPFGVSALDFVLPVVNDRLIVAGLLSWNTLIRTYVNRPREILGLAPVSVSEGSKADLVLFDPNARQTVAVENFCSLGHNSPFVGESLHGTVRNVFVDGRMLKFA